MTFIFVMQAAERPQGEVLYDAYVYERIRMKRPDLSQPQPQRYPEYFGNAKEAMDDYCDMVKARHPEVEYPLELETDEESLLLSSRGLGHDRLNFMNAAVKDSLSTTYTRVKPVNTSDSPIQPRRPTYDVSVSRFRPLSGFRS